MPTTVMWSLPDGDPCSGHSTMIGALVVDDGSLLSHEDPDDVGGAHDAYSVMADDDGRDGASLLMM